MNAGASIGWIAGPIAGGVIYDRWGYSAALIVSIIMAIITLLVALLIVPESHLASVVSLAGSEQRTVGSQPQKTNGFLLNLRSTLPNSLSYFIVLLIIFFAVLFAWGFIEPRFMFYAYNDLGWSSSMLGLMMSAYGVALMFGELVLGQLSDRLGRKPVILMGLVLFSAQFIGMAFFRNSILIAVAFIIAGLGNALYDPALSASILDISPREHRTRILGIKSMVGSFGAILGPALVALLNSSMDARSIFLIAVGIVFLTALIGLIYQGSDRSSKKESGPDDGPGKKVSGQLLKVGSNIRT